MIAERMKNATPVARRPLSFKRRQQTADACLHKVAQAC